MLLLLGMGLWACAGCSPDGPADTREAELPAPAHCTTLGGDPLPSMCAPAGHPAARAQGRAPHVPRSPVAHDGMPAPAMPAPAMPAPAIPVRAGTGTVPAGADAPVSPELMPEAPYSGWGLLGPWIPEPGTWQDAEFADDPSPVLEHTSTDAVPGERPVLPGDPPVVAAEPATVPAVEAALIPAGAPAPDTSPSVPADTIPPVPAEATVPPAAAPATTPMPGTPVPETAVRDA